MRRFIYKAKTICLVSLMISVMLLLFGCRSEEPASTTSETKDTTAVTTTVRETTSEVTTTTTETSAETSNGYENAPEPLDNLISIDIPSDYELEMEYNLDDVSSNPVVQRAYSSDKYGYLTVAVYSYKGIDCLRGYGEKVDVEDDINALKNKREIVVGGETGYFGTRESDDMPDMIATVLVTHGDYGFEFRLTNFDEQVTEEQIKIFEQIISSVRFK